MIMNRMIIAVVAALAAVGCCGEKAGLWPELSGEWNVIEIDGTMVSADSSETKPYIGFSPADSSIFGCAGCNRIVGRIGIDEDATVANFSKIGTTMMLCEDMSVENMFMPALAAVKNYYRVSDNRIELRDADGNVRMVLESSL